MVKKIELLGVKFVYLKSKRRREMGRHYNQVLEKIMQDFTLRTGLIGSVISKRYLWTDAFAVCNFLELYKIKKDKRYLDLAQKLIDEVHNILGRYNETKEWISGLSEYEAILHPTAGGLRIGKPLPQREVNDPFDEQLEWERDGQYFHYLTKWMYALSRMTQVTGEVKYNRWAIELAKVAFEKFSYIDSVNGQRQIYWKMSIDLSRPLVSSMGQHDALDALVTFLELQDVEKDSDLSFEIQECKKMISLTQLSTSDPLGIGGLLSDTYFMWKLHLRDDPIYRQMISASIHSLRSYIDSEHGLNYPAEYRLAFRELGLAIGLKAIQKMDDFISNTFALYTPIADEIIAFWQEEKNQQNDTWKDHIDINTVMIATALAPDGYLGKEKKL